MENDTKTLQELNSSAGTRYRDSDSDPHDFYYIVAGVVGCIVCCLGLLGNALNISIFSVMIKHGARAPATNIFLLSISVVDFAVLLVFLVYDVFCVLTPPKPILDLYSLTIEQFGSASYLIYYIWYIPENALILTSNWLTVSVMVFRFIAVYFPMKANIWCAPQRVKVVLLVVGILAVLSVVPECFTVKLVYYEGFGLLFDDTELFDDKHFHHSYYTYLFLTNSILPFVICLVLSALLVKALRQSNISFIKEGNATHSRKRLKEQRNITIMLLSIVFCYLVCTFPSLLWRALKPATKDRRLSTSVWLQFRAIADASLLLQHSANCLIYIFMNQMYRRYAWHYALKLLRLCKCGPKDVTEKKLSRVTLTTRSFRQRCGTGTSLNRSNLYKQKAEAPKQQDISDGGVTTDNRVRVVSAAADSKPLLDNGVETQRKHEACS